MTCLHEAIIKTKTKYNNVHLKATSLKGLSAGHEPSQVNNTKLEVKDQKRSRARGEKLNPENSRDLEQMVNKNRTKTAATRPKTPPSLLGIERRIA